MFDKNRFGCLLTIALNVVLLLAPAFGQEPKRPSDRRPGVEIGSVSGTVYDSQTGNNLRGASIEAVGSGQKVLTDIDGRYVLKLPVGKHTLRVSMEGYFDQPVDNIGVEIGKTVFIDPVLVPTNVISEKVTVTADSMKAATVNSVLLERQTARTISDTVSAEDISRNPDSDAAGILERVTGISVVQDKYVFVRGLGERYSSAMLNGSLLPSTEPERKVVPFDLFPSSLINKISTLKSYSPDQPGDFSGGVVNIETIEFPAELTLKYSAGLSWDSNVLGNKFLSYHGSHLDWLGFGGGARQLPAAFPSGRVTRLSPVTGKGFTSEQLQELGRSLKNQWTPGATDAAPNFSQTIMGGGSYKNLGTVFSLTYGHKYSHQLEEVNSYQALGNTLIPWNLFTNDKNTKNVKLGFVGNVAYKLGTNHKLQVKNFFSRDASDEVRYLSGYSEGNSADEQDTRLRYSEETIFTSQVSGEHFMKRLFGTLLEWRLAYSRAERDEPDMREVIYRSERGKDDFSFSSQGQSGFRQFTGQADVIYEPAVDVSRSWVFGHTIATLKGGWLRHDRRRDFSSRRFVFVPFGRPVDFRLTPEQIFDYGNIGPDSIELREITRSTDSYDAEHVINAGYGLADVAFAKRWRVTGGVRFEDSAQHLITFDPFAPGLTSIVTDLNNRDFLPAVSVVYLINPGMNLRAGYSRTLNRPEFRELAPFQFTDISGRSTLYGNPDLRQSRIQNVDARWEWFRSPSELYAASVFWKRFEDPIERVMFYSADILTSFRNSDHASNRGIEVEMRKDLGFIGGPLSGWSLYSNYSRIFSDVEIGNIPGIVLTSLRRPMQGQSKYLFNSVLEYADEKHGVDLRVLYNLVGPRISDVGATLLPDVYERSNHFLDLTVSKRFRALPRMQFKLGGQNLLNRAVTHYQGDQVFYRYKLGRQISVGIGYDIY